MVKFSPEFQEAKADIIDFIAPQELDPVERGMLKFAGVLLSPLLVILFGLKYLELRQLKKANTVKKHTHTN